jgi:hypothetical protein
MDFLVNINIFESFAFWGFDFSRFRAEGGACVIMPLIQGLLE